MRASWKSYARRSEPVLQLNRSLSHCIIDIANPFLGEQTKVERHRLHQRVKDEDDSLNMVHSSR